MSHSGEGPVRRGRSRAWPSRRSTTRVVGTLNYEGRNYKLYTNIATPQEERIFFADSTVRRRSVPIGASFPVIYRGRHYTAHKSLRSIRGRLVPVLEFNLRE